MAQSRPARPNSPRKTPRQARSAETVRSIVEAAARVLESRGHAGYNTNAVAQVAGVSPGSLYQYFPNKGALTKALILRETSSLMDEAQDALKAQSGREGLNLFIQAAINHQMRRPVLARLLDLEEAMMPTDSDLAGVTERAHAVLTGILSRPDIPPQGDVRLAAFDVVAIVKAMVDSAGDRGEQSFADLHARVSRAVTGYIQTG